MIKVIGARERAQLVLTVDPINLAFCDASRSDQLTLELLWDMAAGHVPADVQLNALEELAAGDDCVQ